MNGNQNWIQDQCSGSGTNAIWYDNEKLHWKIGQLGSDTCGLYSVTNEIAPDEATVWKYYKNGDWMTTSNGVIFGSLSMY